VTELEKLESMVPPFVREDPVMHAFYAAAAPELVSARAAVADLPLQIWPHLVTWGLARLEQVFGLPTDPSQPLESRRSALVAKLRGSGTSTLAQIRSIAQSFSNGGLAITERFSEYTVEIEFIDDLGVPPYLDSLKAALRAAVPAHLAIDFVLNWLTMDDLKASGKTWGQLKAAGVTWEQLKSYDA
jgi:hypothetical protein